MAIITGLSDNDKVPKLNDITILTYNIFLGKAYYELPDLVKKYSPDIVCLQECPPNITKSYIGPLQLGSSASNGSNGLATYYNQDRLKLISKHRYELPKSLYEKRDSRLRVRQQILEFKEANSNLIFFVSNVHLVHLVAPNSSRRKQLAAVFANISKLANNKPSIVVGDFNYPFFRKGIGGLYKDNGFLEAGVSSQVRSHRFGKFDHVLVSQLEWEEIDYKVLPFGLSDHAPVLCTMKKR